MDKQILTPVEAHLAGYFASPGAAANLRLRGKGPKYIKLNGRIRYRRVDLDAWLASGEVLTRSTLPLELRSPRAV
ncbi:MAG: DNA-binding protein [Deltaproteobacteria bacterium]|nr:DNA-binding protein [Deltaproteobacteria bacterium]